MSEKKNEITTIPEFKGTDLIPLDFLAAHGADEEVDDELVGRENLDMTDFAIPVLALLQPQSPAVAGGMDGARPGHFLITSSDEVIEGPIRAIAVMHSKSRKLNDEAAKAAGATPCRSFDAVEGDVYGPCDECPYSKWGENRGDKPPCALSHDITLLLAGHGPVRMKFKRSGFPAGKNFVQTFLMSRKNLWHHPVILSSSGPHDGPKNSKYYKPKIQWDTTTVVPRGYRDQARKMFEEIVSAFESGKLTETGDDDA